MQARRVRLEEVESGVRTDTDDAGLDRYKVFLKQYKEWVEANKDRLEVESYKVLILHHINAELSAALDWIEKTFSYFFIRLFF